MPSAKISPSPRLVDIERMRAFYEKYFDARSNAKYENERKRVTSYFLTFPGGRLIAE